MRIDERQQGKLGTTLGRRWIGWVMGAALLLPGGCYTGVEEPELAVPRSLAGVDVDGTLTVSSAGDFVLDADARAFFDHFLAAEGELDEADLHAWVRAEIDRRLPEPAAAAAWEAFLAYLDYRREASALLRDGGRREPAVLIHALADVRARTIGDAPGVPDEGPRLRAALAMGAVLDDSRLDAQTRAQRMAALQAASGEALEPSNPALVLRRVHAALAPIAADDVAARRAVLIELVGEPAADRWLALEHQRAEALAAAR